MHTDPGSNGSTLGARASGAANGAKPRDGAGHGSTTGATSGGTPPSWMGKRVGRFRLTGLLGQGAMGRVFRAEDTMLRRQVALKVLPKTVKRGQRTVEAERLVREARAAATLEHPNAVQVYEVNEVGGVYYIAMELVEAGSLRDLVEGQGPLDYVRACQLAAEAADALAHAHSMGIIHRDIKPANLLLTRTGRLKVADFGLARVEDPSDLSSFLAESVGTPQFVAPEILQSVPATAQSDLYSLGATLWYLLAGKPPFEAGTTEELLHKHVHMPLPNLRKLRPDLPDGLVRAISTALAKDPARRHGTTGQFASALRVHTIPVGGIGASSQSLGYVPTEHAPNEVQHYAQQAPAGRLASKWMVPALSAGGAVAIAAVIVGVLLFRGGVPTSTEAGALPAPASRTRASASTAQPTPTPAPASASFEPDASAVPAPAPTPTPPAVAPAQPSQAQPPPPRHDKIVDLMRLIEPTVATVHGNWRFENGDLVSDNGRPATLQIPYSPPAEYDLRVEFTPTSNDISVQLHLHKAPYSFSWAMGSGHDCGFEFVDNKHVWDSAFKAYHRLRANVRQVAVVRVRNGRVQGWMNGQCLVDGPTDYSNFTKNPEFRQPDETRLGLGSYTAPTRFHKVELIEVRNSDPGF